MDTLTYAVGTLRGLGYAVNIERANALANIILEEHADALDALQARIAELRAIVADRPTEEEMAVIARRVCDYGSATTTADWEVIDALAARLKARWLPTPEPTPVTPPVESGTTEQEF